MWDLWWTKWHWDKFYPGTSVSPATHSTDCSTLIIIHHGVSKIGQTVADVPSGFILTPPQENNKKNNGFREEISELEKELREDFKLMALDSGTNK
jgi:hypothetical protein